MSLTSLLSIASSAMSTQQLAMDTAGNNIANASTPGYSQEQLVLEPQVPLDTPMGQLGRGVTAAGITRVRDQFLDASYWQENGALGSSNTSQDLLTQIQNVFGEPSSTGLAAGLDGFFSAWSDLSNNPADPSLRALVQQAGTSLAQQFHSAAGQLDQIQSNVTSQVQQTLADINRTAQQIAQLNVQIRTTSAEGGAPSLMDQRDALVDHLSSLVNVRVIQHGDGTIGVTAGDALLVDGGQSGSLEARNLAGGGMGIGLTGNPGTISLQGGSLGALVTLSQSTLPTVRSQLDSVVAGLVTEVNKLHASGTTPGGATGIPFFDPTGTTAGTIGLSTQVQSSANNIAAGQGGGAADNAIALAIGQLQTNGVASFNGQTIASQYQGMVSQLGVLVQSATQQQTAQQAVVSQIDTQRQSVSGVSIDEEMTHVIAQQNAYSAAAKLVSIADQMMQSVLDMVG
ncbi:MAG TPA: flagellar hook-associated protein FlgK [Gemmatimonadales bacterium]|nr:flagellar hook-associated protein FlgK [Gemmatimonadales bacterium]